MMQQVNLLVSELMPRRERLTLGQLAAVWGAGALVLMAFSAWQGIDLWRLESDRADAQAQASELSSTNAALRSSVRTTPEPRLVTEVEGLRKDFDNEALMVRAVKVYENASGRGFATYLEDLAAQHVDGMTLSRIELQDGGNRIVLSGETEAPVNVPVFLQRLSAGESFQGHRFDEFRLEAQDSGLLHFDITGPQEDVSG